MNDVAAFEQLMRRHNRALYRTARSIVRDDAEAEGSAYLGAVPLFGNRELAKAAASILGDEAMHWAILRNALGEVPVPSAFVA